MDTSRLNPDNVRIGENLRAAMTKQNVAHASSLRLTWRKLAATIGMHHVALARAVAGAVGLSEEKLIALAKALNTHPGHLITGISDRAREDRFPHIPSPSNRNKRDTQRKGMAVASVESLLKNPKLLSSFFGGIAPEDIAWAQARLLQLRTELQSKRTLAIAQGRYDPATGRFTV